MSNGFDFFGAPIASDPALGAGAIPARQAAGAGVPQLDRWGSPAGYPPSTGWVPSAGAWTPSQNAWPGNTQPPAHPEAIGSADASRRRRWQLLAVGLVVGGLAFGGYTYLTRAKELPLPATLAGQPRMTSSDWSPGMKSSLAAARKKLRSLGVRDATIGVYAAASDVSTGFVVIAGRSSTGRLDFSQVVDRLSAAAPQIGFSATPSAVTAADGTPFTCLTVSLAGSEALCGLNSDHIVLLGISANLDTQTTVDALEQVKVADNLS